jgi:peptide/nickel transport system permease protein
MIRFILRRLAALPLVLLLANFFGYTYAYYVGPVQAVRNPYSFGAINLPPFLPQYGAYLTRLLRLDFGIAPVQEVPIITLIGRAGANSLGLLAISLVLSVLIGLFLGFRAVRSSPPKISSWMTLVATVGLASPSFYIGILFIGLSFLYLSTQHTREPLFPIQGFGWDTHLVLPTLALMVRPTVQIAQVTSGMLVGELNKQYITAALSFGHSNRSIRHHLAFRNIIAPVALTIAGSLRLLVAELIIIERLFNWPGLGRLLSTTLVIHSTTDNFLYPPLLAALLMVLVGVFLVADLAASILVRIVDPRYLAAS